MRHWPPDIAGSWDQRRDTRRKNIRPAGGRCGCGRIDEPGAAAGRLAKCHRTLYRSLPGISGSATHKPGHRAVEAVVLSSILLRGHLFCGTVFIASRDIRARRHSWWCDIFLARSDRDVREGCWRQRDPSDSADIRGIRGSMIPTPLCPQCGAHSVDITTCGMNRRAYLCVQHSHEFTDADAMTAEAAESAEEMTADQLADKIAERVVQRLRSDREPSLWRRLATRFAR
jgi:hypothetical protein